MHLLEGWGASLRFGITILLTAVLGVTPGIAGAQATGLPAVSFAAGGTGLTSFYVIGFELGPWQEYLARELTPSYMVPEDAEPVRVSWLNSNEILILPEFATHLESAPSTWFNLNYEWQSSSEYKWPDVTSDDSVYQGTSFERQYFSPGVQHEISDGGVLGVAAIIAYQRYSAANLGLFAATSPDQNSWLRPSYTPYQESGYGTGIRLALHQEIVEGIAFDAGYQSRIDMEEFAAYRGVYAQPADLDIPARAMLGVAFQASERSWLNVAIERVMYSDINAFPSRYLPNRFLSLLGDSSSPAFGWEDLTVYSVGYTWSDGNDQQWHIDLSTRTQPNPTSKLLSQALSGDLAKSADGRGVGRVEAVGHDDLAGALDGRA